MKEATSYSDINDEPVEYECKLKLKSASMRLIGHKYHPLPTSCFGYYYYMLAIIVIKRVVELLMIDDVMSL